MKNNMQQKKACLQHLSLLQNSSREISEKWKLSENEQPRAVTSEISWGSI